MKKNNAYTLYLVRHGQGVNDATNLYDFQRPLSPKGIYKTTQLRKKWEELSLVPPDCILCSSALRAQQTYQLLAPLYPNAETFIKDSLYLAPVARLKETLEDMDPIFQRIMIIGHNKGLEEFMHYLSPENGPDVPLKTASCGVLSITGHPWILTQGDGKLEQVINL